MCNVLVWVGRMFLWLSDVVCDKCLWLRLCWKSNCATGTIKLSTTSLLLRNWAETCLNGRWVVGQFEKDGKCETAVARLLEISTSTGRYAQCPPCLFLYSKGPERDKKWEREGEKERKSEGGGCTVVHYQHVIGRKGGKGWDWRERESVERERWMRGEE